MKTKLLFIILITFNSILFGQIKLTPKQSAEGLFVKNLEEIINSNSLTKTKQNSPKKELLIKYDTINNKLTYLNACNFDFNNSTNAVGYLGHLNVFFSTDKDNNWKINTGLMKINYSSSENQNSSNYQIDNVLIHPLDNITSGSHYIKEYNKYTMSSKISSWSAYLQFMRKINTFKNSAIYFHIHSELLISQVDYSTEITTIQRDTVLANSTPNVYKNLMDRNFSIRQTYIGGYFGSGFTGDFNVFESSDKKYSLEFFAQSTLGITNNQPSPNNRDSENIINQNIKSQSHVFHLTSAYISNKFNGVNIMIGAQIRGLVDLSPLYMFYVGLNTDLKNVAKIFN